MTQSLIHKVRRGLFPKLGLDGKPAYPPLQGAIDVPGRLDFSGAQVEKFTTEIEAGLLARSAPQTIKGLDALVHLLELQVERIVDSEINPKSLSWRTSVVRLMAARTHHGLLRIPGFVDALSEMPQTVTHRILLCLAFFTDLTRQHITENNAPLTPEDWFLADPTYVQMRVNIGVAYYHISRVLEVGDYLDTTALSERDRIFAQNFDVMFYALTYGPLVPGLQTKKNQMHLQERLNSVDQFLHAPQPAIYDSPTRFAVPNSHVLHILTTVDRVKEVLPQLSA